MKRNIIRALTVGAALLVPVTGLTVLGVGTAGAATTHSIGGQFTFTSGGMKSNVKFSSTFTLTSKATWDTASWTGTGTAALPYKDAVGTALAGKSTAGTPATITDSAGREIIVVVGTKVTFTTTVQFIITKGGTKCGILLNKTVVFKHTGSGKKYKITPAVKTAGTTVKHISGSGTTCATITTSLNLATSTFSGGVQFT